MTRFGAERLVVAVDGRTGSGKTALADRLAAQIRRRGTAVVQVHLDQVYPGWSGLEDGVRLVADGVIEPFARGAEAVQLTRWDWTAGREGPVEHVLVPAGAVLLLVEGVGAGARRCRQAAGDLPWLLVLLEAPSATRRSRALARDGDTFAPHWTAWAAQERRHFGREHTRARADLVWSTRAQAVR